MKNYYLEITFGVSRGRDTYGYNIVTVRDGNQKYRTCGGGYDMIGTVFAQWLWNKYKERIIQTCVPVDYDIKDTIEKIKQHKEADYGFFTSKGDYWLDGACGLSSIQQIAKKIGLTIQTDYDRKRDKTRGWIVTDNEN